MSKHNKNLDSDSFSKEVNEINIQSKKLGLKLDELLNQLRGELITRRALGEDL